MKTFYLLFSCLIPLILPAQSASDVPLSELKAEYIELDPETRPGNKIVIDLDFGQKDETMNNKDTWIVDDNGSPLEFNSIIGAVNFMTQYGYELFQVYVVPSDGHGYFKWVMKRKV